MARHSCKIIIVGGSVAGLALANILEQVGTDFIVLEAGKEIHPNVGGGDTIRSLMGDRDNHVLVRNQEGKTIFEFHGLADELERRHGYPVIFVDRPTLLQKLYENIRQKDKIFLQKRLIRLEQGANGVRVITQDECSYDGDFVVGADGMNSAVRKHMHRLASISSPGYFDVDEYSNVPCAYRCIWGISHPVKGVEPGSIHVIMGKDQSYSVFTGPGKLHWLLYVRNPQMMYGKNVPRYSVEDEQRLAEQHFGDPINEYTTFGDVYNSRIVSGMTPLHEYQWKRWYFERIITIGDACHKVHPLGGSGGGAAMEDAAALVNALLPVLDQADQPLSTKDFQRVFAEAQGSQEDRTKHLVDSAMMKQKADAMESIFAPLTVKYIIPNLTHDEALSLDSARAIAGQRIKSLPMPQRDRYIPYNDELPVKPLKKTFPINTCFALVQLLLFNLAFSPSGTSKSWASALGTVAPERYLNPVLDYYASTSKMPIDGLSQPLASGIYIIPIILIWILEGHRRGNIGSLCSWPVTLLFTAAYAVVDPAKLLPLYFLLAIWNSSKTIYNSVMGRPIPVLIATVVIPITCIIYAIYPIVFYAVPAIRSTTERYATDMLRFFPIGIFTVIQLLAVAIKPWVEPSAEKEYMTVYLNKDYPPLSTWYRIIIALSFLGSFFISSASFNHRSVITASILVHCLQSAFQLRILGYATTKQVAIAVVMIILGTMILGPMTIYLGFWYWRENVIYRLSK
ncbi:hypothetical protein ACMFMG_004581 [Clarireedia jacksonii]